MQTRECSQVPADSMNNGAQEREKMHGGGKGLSEGRNVDKSQVMEDKLYEERVQWGIMKIL